MKNEVKSYIQDVLMYTMSPETKNSHIDDVKNLIDKLRRYKNNLSVTQSYLENNIIPKVIESY